jgi:membrane protease YdiL (CAAX protease family)
MASEYWGWAVVLAPLVAAGLIFYAWLLRRQPTEPFEIPERLPFRTGDLICILILVLAAVFLSGFIDPSAPPAKLTRKLVLLNSAAYLALVFFIVMFLVVRKINPVRTFGLTPHGFPAKAWFALLALVAVCPAVMLVNAAMRAWAPEDDREQEIVRFFAMNAGVEDKLAVVAVAVLIAPLTEELIFRGYFYGVIRRFVGRWGGLLISSALFAVVHVHLPSMPALFLLSILLTVIYERTGTLWCPMLAHGAFNALSLALISFFPTEPI